MADEVPTFDLTEWMYRQVRDKLEAADHTPDEEELASLIDQCLTKFEGFIVRYYVEDQGLSKNFAETLASAVCYPNRGRAKYYGGMAPLMEAGLVYAKTMFQEGIHFNVQ